MTGFNGGQIPPKFSQLAQQDLGPYIAQVETFISRLAREVARNEDERIRAVLEEAFVAGINFTQGGRDFDEWLANFIAMNQADRA